MSVVYSVASLYHNGSLQDLLGFLALVSTTSWIVVLFTTFIRFAAKADYKRRARQLPREDAYDA